MMFKSNFDKVLKKTTRTLEVETAKHTQRIGERFINAVASFDEVDVVPIYTKSGASFSLSGEALDKQLEEDTFLSQIIHDQEQVVRNELQNATEAILKEVFKK